MSKAFDYLYYVVYSFAKVISLGFNPQFRAAAITSAGTLFNALALLKFFGLNLITGNFWPIMIGYLGWYYLNVKFFSNQEREHRVSAKFKDEPQMQKLAGYFGVFMYIIITFILFIKAMTLKS